MSQRFSTFDAAALGPTLVLERGDTVLTYEAACDIHRCCRLTDGKSTGRWRAEFFLWGDAAIGDAVALGIVKATHPNHDYVGEHADGVGYRPAEGEIHSAGASIASVAAGAKGDVFGIVLDITDPDAPFVQFTKNGVILHTQSLPDTGPWYLAGTVSGSAGYDLRLLASTGQRGVFEFEDPALGWFGPRESVGMIRIAERGFVTRPEDSPPQARFRGVLREDSRLSLRRSVRAWPMRAGRDGSLEGASGTLRVMNADGGFDALLRADSAGAQVRLLQVPDPDESGVVDYSAAVPLAVLKVDNARALDDAVAELTLTDPIADLALALRRRLARPDADPTSADKPLPVSLGAVRSILPMLLSEPDLTYALHDGPVSGLGTVRDGGYPFDPADYALDANGQLVMTPPPAFTLTADVSASGSAYEPPSPTDALGGAGNPFAGTPGATPTGTTNLASEDAVLAGTSAKFPQLLGEPISLRFDNAQLESGKTYRIELVIGSMMPAQLGTGATPCRFHLCRGATRLTAFHTVTSGYVDEFGNPAYPEDPNPARAAHSVVLVYSPTSSHYLHLVYEPANYDGGESYITSIRAIELIPADLEDEDDAQPLPLEATMQQLVEHHAGWAPEEWDRAAFAAIDAESGYAGIGVHIAGGETATIEATARAVLDTYGADIYRDRAGVLRVWRLTPPEDRTPDFTITRLMMRRDMKVQRYTAPGLTSQARCRKNWHPIEGQISTDTVDFTVAVRERLKSDYRISVASGVPVASTYAHADGAEPFPFLFDRRADAQAELDRIRRYHAVPRFWAEVEVPFNAEYEIGKVALVDYVANGIRRYWDAPRPMEIVGIDEDPASNTALLTLLG